MKMDCSNANPCQESLSKGKTYETTKCVVDDIRVVRTGKSLYTTHNPKPNPNIVIEGGRSFVSHGEKKRRDQRKPVKIIERQWRRIRFSSRRGRPLNDWHAIQSSADFTVSTILQDD